MRFRLGISILATVALTLVPISTVAVAGGGNRAAADVKPVPVILVHGAGSSAAVWGVPEAEGDGRGLYKALRAGGYVPGENLFWLDYADMGDADYALISRNRLIPLVEDVIRRSGSPQVDIVAHSMGALVARDYTNSPSGSGRVRTLVMISPPNRGSFLASSYRRLGSLAEQEALRRRLGPSSGAEADPTLLSAPFRNEAGYVASVARDYFEPLYGRFVSDELFLRDPARREEPTVFEKWFGRTYPADFRTAFLTAVEPPLGPLSDQSGTVGGLTPDDGWLAGEGPGTTLTRGYFHYLALAAARSNYRQLAPWSTVAMEGWSRDVSFEGDWRQSVSDFLLRRAAHLAREAARRLSISLGRLMTLSGTEFLTGLSYRAPAISRMVTEEVPVVGGEAGGERVLANYGLALLNTVEEDERRSRGTRYVTIVGVVPNLWSFLIPEARLNDLAVEAESALLPPGPLDIYKVVAGLKSASHSGLVREKAVHAFIINALAGIPSVTRQHELPVTEAGLHDGWLGGEARVNTSAPSLIEIVVPDGAVPVELEVSAAPEAATGLDLEVYLVRTGDGMVREVSYLGKAVSRRDPLRSRVLLQGGALGTNLLAVRPVPKEGGSPSLQRLRHPTVVRFSYRLRKAEEGPEKDGMAGSETPGMESDPSAGGENDPVVSTVYPTTPGTGSASEDADGTVSESGIVFNDRTEKGIPRIDVVYRNKHTTLKKEDRTYHVRWEWGFGDGTTRVDGDPSHVISRVSHTFPPGTFTVTARSVSNKGSLLREISWTVTIPESTGEGVDGGGVDVAGSVSAPVRDPLPPGPRPTGRTRTFEAETLREPVPEITVTGPVEWLTGRSASFHIDVQVPPVPFLSNIEATFYPARDFEVRWKKPGLFKVQGAVTLKLTYDFPEGRRVITNTYVKEVTVDVLALSVTD